MTKSIYWKYPEHIVQAEWLKNEIDNEKIRIFDCTTYLHYTDNDPSKPYIVESGFEDYKNSHIPGASFLDLQKDLSNNKSAYRFTLPNWSDLAQCFMKLGIGEPFNIILYSRNGLQWSTRVWWMLYTLGFNNVSVLDGGLIEWQRLGYLTEKGIRKYNSASFKSNPKNDIFVYKEKVLSKIGNKSCIILNALTEDIHLGLNPRYGRLGRIPGSLNIPFHDLVNTKSGKLKQPSDALKIFKDKGFKKNHEIINYCGGGIAATLDAFVLLQLGYYKIKIYDNSMSEWAMDKSLPIET